MAPKKVLYQNDAALRVMLWFVKNIVSTTSTIPQQLAYQTYIPKKNMLKYASLSHNL